MKENGVSLKEFFSMRLDHVEENVRTAKAEMDRRLDGMNEFREQLRNQEQTYATRREVEIKINAMDADIRILRESRAQLEGKASQNSFYVSLSIAAFGLIVSIVTLIIYYKRG